MTGMTSFVRRVGLLAAAAFLVAAVGVGAEAPKFVISAGGGDGLFTVKQNSVVVRGGENVSIDSVMEIIREVAGGLPVEINFDSAEGGLELPDGVGIGAGVKVLPAWGKITLSGKLRGVVVLRAGMYMSQLVVVNKANVYAGNDYAIWAEGEVNLTLAACTLSTASLDAVRHTGGYGSADVVVQGGKYTSKTGYAIYTRSNVKIENGWFESTEGACVYSLGDVEIENGTFTSKKTTVYSGKAATITRGTFESTSGSVLVINGGGDIFGGEFATTGSGAAMEVRNKDVGVFGGARFINNSADTATIQISGGSVTLDDVEIKNKNKSGSGVSVLSAGSSVTLGKSAKIDGMIASRFAGAIYAGESFKPDVLGYKLKLTGGACVNDAVAVVGGGKHILNFKIIHDYYHLEESRNNIIVKLDDNVEEPEYLIVGGSESEFIAERLVTPGKYVTVGKSNRINNVLDSINVDADGKPCGITFGTSGAGINVGKDVVSINGNMGKAGWGRISLTGKITVERPDASGETGGLVVSNGVSVACEAEVSTATHRFGVDVQSGSDFTYKGDSRSTCGSIRNNGASVTVLSGRVAYIDNTTDGFLKIAGGTVGSDTLSGYAIKNAPHARVFISGSPNIVSANARYDGGTIINNGLLEISGGEVSNVNPSPNYTAIAISNGYSTNDTTAVNRVHISGTAKIFAGGRGNEGVVYNGKGEMTISGGEIYSTGDTVDAVVVNFGKLIISDLAEIKSNGRYFSSPTSGVVYSAPHSLSVDGIALEIYGGAITAEDGYAVSVANDGGAVISDDAEITSEDSDGVVFIGANAYLNLYGGTIVSKTAENGVDSAKVIDTYGGGRGGSNGRLAIGGSPILKGIISLPEEYGSAYPITINAGRDKFDPKGNVYRVATPLKEGRVILENGAKFLGSFVLDTVGYKGFKLAVNGDDAVAAKNICTVDFDLNGSTTKAPPAAIPVMEGGTIGKTVRPSTEDYVIYDSLPNGVYLVENDGEWHIHNGESNGAIIVGGVFDFGVEDDNATKVRDKRTLTLRWSGKRIPFSISVLEPTRDLPAARTAESATVSPVAAAANGLTAGPNPAAKPADAVNFFRTGVALKGGKLFIYDASGNVVTTLTVNDTHSGVGRRSVASWDLRDAKGRQAAEGTYVAKGVVTTKAGKTERVSVLIGVQR